MQNRIFTTKTINFTKINSIPAWRVQKNEINISLAATYAVRVFFFFQTIRACTQERKKGKSKFGLFSQDLQIIHIA